MIIPGMSSDDLTRQASTEDKIDSLIALAQQIAADVKILNGRVDSLEQKADARLQDTRPIWEAVQSQITGMRDEMNEGFHNIERRLDVVSADINKIRADLRFLENRMDKLEEKAS